MIRTAAAWPDMAGGTSTKAPWQWQASNISGAQAARKNVFAQSRHHV